VPQPKLIITKQFTYQGVGKEWSNAYSIAEGPPLGYSAWSTFAHAVVTAEKAVLQNDVTIVKAVGFDGSVTYPAYSEVFATVGTLAVSGASNAPRDCAAIVRYTTAGRSSKNHPIYAFNYYHGVADYDSGSGHPAGWLYEPQRAALEAYAQAWIDGIGGYTRATPSGEAAIDKFVDPWIRHRDFPL
jgi:hypothetical protein